MILTVTMNPAIDIAYPLETLKLDRTNRVLGDKKSAGGKGLNVTRVLHLLGKQVIATGFLGGALGTFIEERLEDEGITHNFLRTKKESRICIAILHDEGHQTEILESGPTFTEDELTAFFKKFEHLIRKYQFGVITLSGSLPNGVGIDCYSRMIKIAHAYNVKILLDSSGEPLKHCLNSEVKPFLIKPNEEELEGLIGSIDVSSDTALMKALNNPLFDGIEMVVVSLGAGGALVKFSQNFYRAKLPVIEAISPVGSGDATIAGFAAAIDDGGSVEEIIRLGMTTGILNTLESRTGYIDASRVSEIYDRIEVNQVIV